MEKHVYLVNRWGCDIQRSHEASSCSVENRLKKLISGNKCHITLSGAEESIKELPLGWVFLCIRSNRKGCPHYSPKVFCVYLLKIKVIEAPDHSYLQMLKSAEPIGRPNALDARWTLRSSHSQFSTQNWRSTT